MDINENGEPDITDLDLMHASDYQEMGADHFAKLKWAPTSVISIYELRQFTDCLKDGKNNTAEAVPNTPPSKYDPGLVIVKVQQPKEPKEPEVNKTGETAKKAFNAGCWFAGIGTVLLGAAEMASLAGIGIVGAAAVVVGGIMIVLGLLYNDGDTNK